MRSVRPMMAKRDFLSSPARAGLLIFATSVLSCADSSGLPPPPRDGARVEDARRSVSETQSDDGLALDVQMSSPGDARASVDHPPMVVMDAGGFSDAGPIPDAIQPPGRVAARAAEVGDAQMPGQGGLMVDVSRPQIQTFRFRPSEADPAASLRDEEQIAILNTFARPRGKLAVVLAGTASPPGPLNVVNVAAALGYHALAIAYENSPRPFEQNDPDFFGKLRFEQLDGTDRTPAVTILRPDSVEERIGRALAFLQRKHPGGDWTYFLESNAQVRWADVILVGYSHGASSAAAFAKVRRVSRVVSLAGPRDTFPVIATWLTMPSLTPIDRFYALTATGDDQHQDHLKAMNVMGYLGPLVDVAQETPPYAGTHRLQHAGGHGDSAACDRILAACKYLLGAN